MKPDRPLRVISHAPGGIPTIPPRTTAWNPALDAALIPAGDFAETQRRLRSPGALAVTTGQQPGLFTGPIYTIHKAIAAAALARRLEEDWNRPVVPIFWLAGDDHDYAEGSTAAWSDVAGTFTEWHLPARPASAPQRSLANEQLPPDILQGLDRLESSLPSGPAREETLAWLRRHYVVGATLHRAAAGAIAELLAPLGIVCFDPTHPAAKAAQAPLIQDALGRALELDQLLAGTTSAPGSIPAGEGATLVFLETEEGRDRLVVDGKGFVARRTGKRYSSSALEQLLKNSPEQFSANVLLRPVVESALLPTVAYVAGPAEMQYLSRQAALLYPRFNIPPQMPTPRWSGTLIEPWSERLLNRLGVSAEMVLADTGELARSILYRDVPAGVVEAVHALRAQISRSVDEVAAAGRSIDSVLDRAIDNRRRRLEAIAEDLEGVIARHVRKRKDIAHAQYLRLLAGLRPRGQPQERVFTAATFLGRYGHDWLEAINTSAREWATDGLRRPVAAGKIGT